MDTTQKAILAVQGSIQTAPTITSNNNLGTSQVSLQSADTKNYGSVRKIYRYRILNMDSSNKIAVGINNSSVSADESNANAGIIIMPEQELTFSVGAHLSVHIVASASGTSYNVAREEVLAKAR